MRFAIREPLLFVDDESLVSIGFLCCKSVSGEGRFARLSSPVLLAIRLVSAVPAIRPVNSRLRASLRMLAGSYKPCTIGL